MAEAQFKIFRGEGTKGGFVEFQVEVTEGMVVLDAVQQIQSRHANDLAVHLPALQFHRTARSLACLDCIC